MQEKAAKKNINMSAAADVKDVLSASECKLYDSNLIELYRIITSHIALLSQLNIDGSVLFKSGVVKSLKEFQTTPGIPSNMSQSAKTLLDRWKSQVSIIALQYIPKTFDYYYYFFFLNFARSKMITEIQP